MEKLVRPQEIVILTDSSLNDLQKSLHGIEGKVDMNTFVVRCDSVNNSQSGVMFTAHFRLIPN